MMIVAADVPQILTPQTINGNSPLVGWRNLATLAAVTASGSAADNPVANVTVPSTYARWEADDVDAHYLQVDLDGSEVVDYIGVAVHNFGSAGVQIAVDCKYASDGAFTEYIAATDVDNDGPLIIQMAPRALFGVKLRMLAGDAAPTVAVLYVGRLTKLQRRLYVGHSPLSLNVEDEVTIGRAERGQYLGRIVLSSAAQGSISLQNLTPDWVRDELMPWRRAGRGRPFFFAWRPYSYPDETALAWFTNNPSVGNQRATGLMNFSANVSALVRTDHDDE